MNDDKTRQLPIENGPSGTAPAATAAVSEQVTVSQTAVALPPGTVLHSKFQVVHVLGKPGGFGIAYLCNDMVLNRQVVIKELFPYGMVSRLRDSTEVGVVSAASARDFDHQLQLLLEEARQLAALDDIPAVVKVYDHFTENRTGYIVMRHVQGRTLSERLKDFEVLEPAQVMRWVWPLLDGLQAVHQARVLHRDIKPDNVLIDARDRPVLIDFGNSAALREAASHDDGYYAVSPYYGAPEQYANDVANMGPWTDLYAVGAVMYFAFTRTRPVDASRRRQGQPMPSLRQKAPLLPVDLADAVDACLALDPSQRPQSVAALKALLARYEPAARHWTDALPANAFGKRMRQIDAKVKAGQVLPRQWNTAAALGQAFWFLLYRQTAPGLALAAWTILVALVVLWSADPWPRLPWALALAWLPTVLPSGLWGDFLRWHDARRLADQSQPDSDHQFGQLRQTLMDRGRPYWQWAPALALLPAAWLACAWGLEVRLQQTRHTLSQAIALTAKREEFKTHVLQHGRPPAPDELPPFTPNSEVSRVELRPSGLEVVLALPPVAGRRVRWTLDASGQWLCQPVDLPERFVPDSCSSDAAARVAR